MSIVRFQMTMVDECARHVINRFRYDLLFYKLKVDDPILEKLENEGLVKSWDINSIVCLPTPTDRMSYLVDKCRMRVTSDTFYRFLLLLVMTWGCLVMLFLSLLDYMEMYYV